MRAPLSDAVVSVDEGGALSLRERESLGNIVQRALLGLFPFACGVLVVYVFLSPTGPRPMGGIGRQLPGWIAIVLFLTALGLVPIYWGLDIWFVRRVYTIRPAPPELESLILFAGVPLWRSCYPLSAFQRVLISREKRGRFGTIFVFVVSCDGPLRRIDLAESPERASAERLAAEIARHIALPVESDLISP